MTLAKRLLNEPNNPWRCVDGVGIRSRPSVDKEAALPVPGVAFGGEEEREFFASSVVHGDVLRIAGC